MKVLIATKNIKGITLVALVVTIIILIILVGVTINIILSDNGILEKTRKGKEQYEKAQVTENTLLGEFEDTIDEYGFGGIKPIPEISKIEIVLEDLISPSELKITANIIYKENSNENQ